MMKTCLLTTCIKASHTRGYCTTHYARWRIGKRGAELSEPVKLTRKPRTPAAVMYRDENGNKECPNCLQWLPEFEFIATRAHSSDGLNHRCTGCKRAAKYGLTRIELTAKLESQSFRCAICNDPLRENWVVDHDHSCCPGQHTCGKCVREILCHGCNVGIGILGESVERMTSVINYLSRYSVSPV